MRKQAYWLTIAFIFTVPWESAIEFAGGSRGSRYLGLIVAGIWAISVILRGRIRRLEAYFLFLLWNCLTLLWSIDPNSTVTGFITYTQIFGMILILWDLIETEKQVETALQALVLGAYITCTALFVNWLTNPTSSFAQHNRIDALGFHVDGVALVIAVAIPAAWHLATGPNATRLSKPMLAVNFAYLPVAVFAMILTGTRGAAVASFPTFLYILWTLRRSSSRRRLVAATILGLAVFAVIFYAPPEMMQRIGGSVTDIIGGDSLSGRREIWADSLETFAANPLVGVGLEAHVASSYYDKEAHNTLLSILVESGLIGFLAFGAVGMALLSRLLQFSGPTASYWWTQISVLFLGSMSLSIEESKPLWILCTLAVISAVAIRADLAKPPPERSMLPSVWGAGAVDERALEPRTAESSHG